MGDFWLDLTVAFGETFQMVSIATLCAIVGGLPLGLLIFITDRNLFWQNRAVYLSSTIFQHHPLYPVCHPVGAAVAAYPDFAG